MSLEKMPGWMKKLDDHAGKFTEAGLNGLIENYSLTNELGERLMRGELKLEDLKRYLFPPKVGGVTLDADPQAFWSEVYRELFGRPIDVPPVPMKKLRAKTRAASDMYKLMLVFIPAVSEDEYPTCFVKPAWGKHIDVSKIERRTLPGRWVLVDTTPKPNYNDKSGYQDRLTKDLDLTTRFNTSWNDCENVLLPKFARLLGLSRKAVRLMTAEEWNFVANLFNWLRLNRSMNLPDLGATQSWDWCDNRYGGGYRLLVGHVEHGGLAGVDRAHPMNSYDALAFRVLAVL